MSRKVKIIIAAGALVAAGAAVAISQTGGPYGRFGHGHGPHGGGYGFGPPGPEDGLGGGGFRDRFRGQTTREEFDARTRERFARLDRNNDGVIDTAEVEAMMTESMRGGPMGRGGPGERMGQHMLRFFDADRDGKVTRDEFLAGVRKRFAELDLDGDGRITDADLPPLMRGRGVLAGDGPGGRGHGRGGMGLGLLRDADANRDGVITIEEAIAAAERRFALWDRNRDGIVDEADRAALRKETLDYRVRRFMHHYGASDGRITREQFAAKAGERFALMDLNNDGVIGRDERPGRGWGGWRHRHDGDDDRGPGWRGRGGGGPGRPDGPGAPDGERGPPPGKGGPGGGPGSPRGI